MNRTNYVILGIALALPGSATAVDFAVGAQGGTLGTGLQITYGLTEHFNLRAGINSSEYEHDMVDIENSDGLTYENPTIDFDNQYLFLDIYPFSRGNLHLTAGYVKNNNSITTTAEADGGEVFGEEFADADTRVSALINFEDGAYAGIGWGNAVKGGLIHFGFDLGVVMQGSPKVEIEVLDDPSGGALITDEDIEAEEQELEEDAKDADMWPVISLSMSIQLL
ncbi:MAG TPA: hypothetical protein VGL10_04975 [Gammaproteobacteria bacterium]